VFWSSLVQLKFLTSATADEPESANFVEMSLFQVVWRVVAVDLGGVGVAAGGPLRQLHVGDLDRVLHAGRGLPVDLGVPLRGVEVRQERGLVLLCALEALQQSRLATADHDLEVETEVS